MTRQQLIDAIEKYRPYNEQEEMDKPLILNWIKNEKDAFLRENKIAHITASAWVVNKDRSKVLMVYHNIYHSWSWLGGHADGETDLLSVAIREVKEEAGISKVYPVSEEIFSLESLTVDGHVKNGKYVIQPSAFKCNIPVGGRSERECFRKSRREQWSSLVFSGRSTGKVHGTMVCGACIQKTDK